MSQPPELELLQRIEQGDEDALLALHRRYAGAVYSVAYRVLNEPMAAEEVTQDTFLRLWDKAYTFDPAKGAFLPWLLTIARRRAIDTLRQQQRHQLPAGATFSLDEHPYLWEQIENPEPWERHDLRQALVTALRHLPPEQREAIELAYFHGLSHREAAAHLQVPLGTIKTRLRLGMQKLRETWLAQRNPMGGGEA